MKDSVQCPIAYFRLKSTESNSRTSIGNMARAIDSLAHFVDGVDFSFDSFDIEFLGEWVAHQFYDGYYAKTIAYNISKIAALYNKAVDDGLASPQDSFPTIIAKINRIASQFDGIKHAATFQRLQMIVRADYSTNHNKQLAKDIILFGIFNGGMTLEQIAAFKKDGYDGGNEHIAEIVKRYSKPRNKYLFPLNQAHSTPKQLLRTLGTLISAPLMSAGIKISANPDMTLADLWCDVAMSCGISSHDIAACVSNSGVFNAMTFFTTPSEISHDTIARIREQITDALTDNPVRWYAMHLRRHAGYKALTDRLNEKGITLDEIYYPMEEIVRKTGKRKIFERQPVISWLIFFRTRVTQLNRLFQEIGDLAWGYRYVRDVKSPYAVISDNEIGHYQEAIGTLSPSTEMLPDEAVKLNKGDCLVILGGPMNGRHGIFISEKRMDKGKAGSKIVYRIGLAGGNNANWEVSWDSQLVKKISEVQYKELDRQFQERMNEEQYV